MSDDTNYDLTAYYDYSPEDYGDQSTGYDDTSNDTDVGFDWGTDTSEAPAEVKSVDGDLFRYDAEQGEWVSLTTDRTLSNSQMEYLEQNEAFNTPSEDQSQAEIDRLNRRNRELADAENQSPAETDRLNRQNAGQSGLGNISPGSKIPDDTKGDGGTKSKGKIDPWAGIGAGLALLLLDRAMGGGLLSGKQRSSGYTGAINLGARANRMAVANAHDPNVMPGSGGISYLTPFMLSQEGSTGANSPENVRSTLQGIADERAAANARPRTFAQGGIAAGAEPGYLSGPTDGMEDAVPAILDDGQPARLAHGEFVIPADVVSHLGNGNSEAGAQKLYELMDQVRSARTGTTEQGKQIDPDEFLSAATGGGITQLAREHNMGGVRRFTEGGTTTPTAENAPLNTYFGPYVNTMMTQANALAEAPYQAYQGPRTASTSPLQDQAYMGASSLNMPQDMGTTGFQPTSFTTPGVAQQYMNPYIQNALNPTLSEMRRQSEITQMQNNARMVGAGAYGGSRQALMNTETQRTLLDKMGQAIGQSYASAYDKGIGQFNTEQQQRNASQQAINRYGVDVLNLRNNLGNQQRDIMQQGVEADKAAFEEERANPYKMLQFKQAMLSGMPIENVSSDSYEPSLFSQLAGLGYGGLTLAEILERLGGND